METLLVGAPLGNNLQPDTVRSGALFKCPISTLTKDCKQVETDGRRLPSGLYKPQDKDVFYDDLQEEDNSLKGPGPDEIKNGQWLGVTVKSSNPSNGGKVLVCAHRYIKSPQLNDTHHGLGLCHLLNASLGWEEALEPCEGKPMQNEHLEYAYCQAGTSLAFLEDGTALMGAPGPHTWRGTIFAKMTVGDFLSRDKNFYSSPLNQLSEPIDKYSYLGMSVTGGRFFDKHKITYVSGASRANLTGQVYFIEKIKNSNEMAIRLILKGVQVASNYGYELLAADVNGDGYDDLLVAAPFFFNNTVGGAVYIYYNLRACTANYTCTPDQILTGKEESRFGFAMAALGDINKDGYNDIAIGAPYETYEAQSHSGAIYIYLGNHDQLNQKEAQKISIPQYTTIGYSLSGGVDMDGNGYPDLLTGAYNEDTVILFKTRPIVDIEIDVQGEEMRNIDVTKKGCKADPTSTHSCFSFAICIRTNRGRPPKEQMSYELKADCCKTKRQYIRVKLNSTSESNILTQDFRMHKNPTCRSHTVYIKDGIRDILSPIEFSVNYQLQDTPHSPILNQTSTKDFQATFLKDCGSNEVCESELKVSVGLAIEPIDPENNYYALDLGNVEELNVQVNVSNEGESAYEAQLLIIHSKSLSYIALNDKMGDIKCVYHNDTCIACNLGNPFGKKKTEDKKEVHLGLRFENRNNVNNDGILEFHAKVNTTSNITTTSVTSATAKVAVKMTPNIKIDTYGTSYVNYGGRVQGESAFRYFDEIGSRISHRYQVTNEGKWAVSNLEAYIDWPIQIQSSRAEGKWLLYLESTPHVDFESTQIKCEIMAPHVANEKNYTNRPSMSPENLEMSPLSSFDTQPPPFNTRNRRSVEGNQEVEEDIMPARLMLGSGELIKIITPLIVQLARQNVPKSSANCQLSQATLVQL
ncbi:integrin alpha-PS1 isoform X3 [Atheta coriaria]|uniref:integrin alpha-PS1 isoform X3 n=1 Tax=Dalotia coriaria TaxID=877792 RepID=UPI0031F3DA81